MLQQHLANIQKWLQQHATKIANQSLNPPATTQDLAQFEQKLGQFLPQDFKELYLWHNGMNEDENIGSLFYGMDFLSLERIGNMHDDIVGLENKLFALDHADPQINSNNAHNPNWIIFAHDGAHTGLYLDLDPTSEGILGQVIFIDSNRIGILVANSVYDLVQQFSDDLEKQLYHLNEDALEDDNEFLDCDDSIDLVNWYFSERWLRPNYS